MKGATKCMKAELEMERRTWSEALKLMECWGPRLPINWKNQLRKRDLFRCNGQGRQLSMLRIEEMYKELQTPLGVEFASTRTNAEFGFDKILRNSTSLNFKRSYWIGCFVIDIFFDQIGTQFTYTGKKYTGIAIEIDGLVHDHELKMRKDSHKVKALAGIGICLTTIRNDHIRHWRAHRIAKLIASARQLDTREKRRLRCRIHLMTIFCWLSYRAIDRFFEVPFGTTLELMNLRAAKEKSKIAIARQNRTCQ